MMNRRPTRTETLLRELAGHGLLGATSFLFRVFLGVVAIPMQVFWYICLKLYYVAISLHDNGEKTILAVNRFIEAGRRDYD